MKFYEKYHLLKSRVAPFRLKTDFETIKTVATIDALLDRADVISNGNVPGRYILKCPPGLDVENLYSRAEKYVTALENGETPLKGKFTEPGISLSDHSFIVKDGEVHVFYNRGFIGYDWPERAVETIGHATTKDFRNWTILPPVISVERDSFAYFNVWSPSVVERDGIYYMLYTGVNAKMAEAMCLATSKDLTTWEKYSKQPVYIPGEWSTWDENKWSDCRDPFVFKDDDGTYYLFFCTMVKTGKRKCHNAMGIASSKDLIHWKDEKQFLLEGCDHMPESPFVIKHNGKYYLFYTNCGKGTCYAVADSPTGEYAVKDLIITCEKLSSDLAHVPSCSEIVELNGKMYISYATRLPGNEQYLEIAEFFWNEDGSVTVGKNIK